MIPREPAQSLGFPSKLLATRANEVFNRELDLSRRSIDYFFAMLLMIQFVAAITLVIWFTPFSWKGMERSIHSHVWITLHAGVLMVIWPLALVWKYPGWQITRLVIAASQALLSTLLIHLSGGRIETHFHIFVSLAFLSFYRDWRVLVVSSLVVLMDHLLRGLFLPQSIYGVSGASVWRTVEHAGWVVLELAVLIVACRQSLGQMFSNAVREAQLENINSKFQSEVEAKTFELERKNNELLKSISLGNAILDAQSSQIVIIDQSENVVRSNASWRENYTQQFTGDSPGLFPNVDDLKLMEGIRLVLSGRSNFESFEFSVTKDGFTRWYSLEVTPCNSLDRNAVVVQRDVTQQIIDAKQLKLAKEQAEAASRSKSDFLANMSHEIRTPMTAIIGFAELLESDFSMDPVQSANAIQTIRTNANHLLTIINDILDMSKIEAGRLNIESIETFTIQILEELASTMIPHAKGKGIQFQVLYDSPIPDRIQSDPTRLRQILVNLLGNAIKFTEVGTVTVRVSCDLDNSMLMFRVIDTGIGMSEIERVQVTRFDAFSQADSTTTRKFGGSGLGLRISNYMATMLGGEIRVESEKGVGSTFTASIRMGDVGGSRFLQPTAANSTIRNASRRIGADEPAGNQLDGVRILLAEDGPDNQRLISFHLKKAGAFVQIAGNGRMAVEMLQESDNHFDFVLMDMQMPELDGYQATIQLRKLGFQLPIIALTAHAMDSDRQKCLSAGCDGYATKPIDPKLLIAIAKDAVLKSRSSPSDLPKYLLSTHEN